MDDRLTIIIFTHNRHGFLKRSIGYYGGIKYPVVILDSSDEAFNAAFPANVQYHRYPKLHFIERIFKGEGHIQTPYSVLCADDDFHSISALGDCVDFLDGNNDYVCAQGQGIVFEVKNGSINVRPYNTHGKDLVLDSDKPEERLSIMMNNYIPFFYAVMRTRVMFKIMNSIKSYNITTPALFEVGNNMLLTILGKIQVLDRFYSARQKLAGSAGRTALKMDEIVMNDGLENEFSRFKTMIVEALRDQQGISTDRSISVVNDALDGYINVFIPAHKKKQKREMHARVIYDFINTISRKLILLNHNRKSREYEFAAIVQKKFNIKWDDKIKNELIKIENCITSNPM